MGRIRVTPGEFVTPERYFATYVNDAFTRLSDGSMNLAANSFSALRDHLINYGASILGNRADAVEIVDEWLAQRGG